MAFNKINSILEKYWEGNSSLEEEATLRDYFSQENIAPELLQYKPLFQFFTEEQEMNLSSDFDTKFLERIQAPTPPKKQNKVRRLYRFSLSAAAAVVLLFGVYFAYVQKGDLQTKNTPTITVYDDNPEDARKAYEEFKNALKLVSSKMDKGTTKASFGLSKVKTVAIVK